MSKKKNSGTNFLVQGSILAIASIISRMIGLIYRIPMNDIIGDVGNDYYACAFDVYNVMLIISSYSLPIAVAKLVSAQIAKGRRRMAYRIFKCALLFVIITAGIAGLIVYFGAEFFTGTLLKTPNSVFALKILAPALVVVAILGVIRGFFQGVGTMIPSAISQIIEQVVNAVVSVWAAYVLYQKGAKVGAILGQKESYAAAYGAAGGTLGTNLGSVAGLLFVLLVFAAYMKVYKKQMKRERNAKVSSVKYTFALLIATIIPILLSTIVYSTANIINQGLFKNIAFLQGYKASEINIWWGVYTGKYKLMVNVPVAIASAIATSSVPSLTASFAEENYEQVKVQINAAMRFIVIISLPSAVGLAVLAEPIFTLLFPGTVATAGLAATIMLVGCCSVVFYSISTLSNGLLQGIGRLKEPVRNGAIALVLQVIVLVVLMMFFRLNIYSVVVADASLAFFMCILNGYSIKKYSGYNQEVKRTFLIPALCSTIMGFVAFFGYKGVYLICKINAVALIVAIVLAIIVYAVTLLLFKGLTEEELEKFPKGTSLVRLAKKLHLM